MADSSAVNHFQVESLFSEWTKVTNFCPAVYLPCLLILIKTLHNYQWGQNHLSSQNAAAEIMHPFILEELKQPEVKLKCLAFWWSIIHVFHVDGEN